MRWIIAATSATLLVLTAPTMADWLAMSSTDKMTDKASNCALLPAKGPDAGITASLLMMCGQGRRVYSLEMTHRFTRGRMSAEVRFDDGPVTIPSAEVFSAPTRIYLLSAPEFAIPTGKKRMRLRLWPTGGESLFYDFDLAGTNKAFAAIRC